MREELTAEAVALSWKWWLRLRERGKDPRAFVSAIATFACRVVHSGRRLCGMDRAKDVLSCRAQHIHSFSVGKLPDVSSLAGNPLTEALEENTVTPVDQQAAFRHDFPLWLSGLDEQRRTIILMMMGGERTSDIAAKVDKSPARISLMRQEFF
jgi:hypothetical protein